VEKSRVIPYASDLDTAAQPQAGEQVGPVKACVSLCVFFGLLLAGISSTTIEQVKVRRSRH